MEPTWTTRELPVLAALVAHFDQTRIGIGPQQLAEATGLSEHDVEVALHALSTDVNPPYITGIRGLGDRYPVWISDVTERARRAVGQWPATDSAADVALAALEALADREPDPEKKSRIRSVAGFFGGMGRDVLVEFLAALSKKTIGG